LTDAELRYELHESHRILSEQFGDNYLPVMAYPWGDYDQRVVDMMAETPYRYGMTVEPKPWETGDPQFEVPRYSAYDRDANPAVLLAKLWKHKLLFA
jgi:peptidoglycan/xylan/chitin deacetylase (PgdA/CDA1 family)